MNLENSPCRQHFLLNQQAEGPVELGLNLNIQPII